MFAAIVKNPRSARAILVLFLLVLVLAVPHRTRSQTAVPATGQPRSIPPRVVYEQFFRHVMFLEKQADALDQQGKDGSQLRNFYQHRAGLSTAEATLMKQVAADALAAVKVVDQRVHEVAVNFRAGLPARVHTPLPSPPPELRVLQGQRDRLMLDRFSQLQSRLGPQAFQRLDAFVQRQLTPHITLNHVPPPTVQGTGGGIRIP